MVELVDTMDLKSIGHCNRPSSSLGGATISNRQKKGLKYGLELGSLKYPLRSSITNQTYYLLSVLVAQLAGGV